MIRGGGGPPPPLGVAGAVGCGNIVGPPAAIAECVEGGAPGSARYDSNVPRRWYSSRFWPAGARPRVHYRSDLVLPMSWLLFR